MLKTEKKTTSYNTYRCDSCDFDCLCVPLDAGNDGKPKFIIVVCPQCLTAVKMGAAAFEKSLA